MTTAAPPPTGLPEANGSRPLSQEAGLQERVVSTQLGSRGKAAIKPLSPAGPLARKLSPQLLRDPTLESHGRTQSYGCSSQCGLWGRSRSLNVLSGPGLCPGVHVRASLWWSWQAISSVLLYPGLLFDPVPQYGEPCVHAWLVPLSTAFSPAHHTSLEDSPF